MQQAFYADNVAIGFHTGSYKTFKTRTYLILCRLQNTFPYGIVAHYAFGFEYYPRTLNLRLCGKT